MAINSSPRVPAGRSVVSSGLRVFFSVVIGCCVGFAHAQICATPGKDGASTTVAGTINTYYPPNVGATALTVNSASTSIPLGTATGSVTAVAPGDLVVVMQMQCENINTSNTAAYGGGGTTGRGYTDPAGSCLAGQYEYVRAGAATTATSLDLSGSPLANTYVQDPTTATNRRSFQVIRVPQYSAITLSGTVTSPYWNGSTGGVVIMDVAGELNWGTQIIDVSGRGFRGAGGLVWNSAAVSATDYVRVASAENFHASKGEGIAGTPRFVLNQSTVAIVDNGATWGGYAGGDFGRGAPGNAGGGGDNFDGTRDNGGGGGGGNGGIGGFGAYGWKSTAFAAGYVGEQDLRGIGGADFAQRAISRVVMGGGGGAGSNNNSVALTSSGGAGGGIVMVRAGSMTGTGTINANGANGQTQLQNDSGGGGGAGGSVIVQSQAAIGTLSINALGGVGGNGCFTSGTNTCNSTAHAGGGGGAGGVVFTSGTPTSTLAGGANGVTNAAGSQDGTRHGASSGGAIAAVTGVTTDPAGAESGPRCLPQLTTTKVTSTPAPGSPIAPPGTTTYTIRVANAATAGTASAVQLFDPALPASPNITVANPPVPTVAITATGGTPTTAQCQALATRSSATDFANGASTNLSAGNWLLPGGCQIAYTFTANVGANTPNGTYQNDAGATFIDPTRNAASPTRRISPNTAGVTPPAGVQTTYQTGGTAAPGGSNYDGDAGANSAEDILVQRSADLAITKTDGVTLVQSGATTTYTLTITNNGPSPVTGASLRDPVATGLNCTAVTCTTASGGAAACNTLTGVNIANLQGAGIALGTMPSGASYQFTVTCTVTATGN